MTAPDDWRDTVEALDAIPTAWPADLDAAEVDALNLVLEEVRPQVRVAYRRALVRVRLEQLSRHGGKSA